MNTLLQVTDIAEFIGSYKDVGLAGIALLIVAKYARWMAEKAFSQGDKVFKEANSQLAEANLRAKESQDKVSESQKEFREFITKEYVNNQQIMTNHQQVLSNLAETFKIHNQTKDKALNLIEKITDSQEKSITNINTELKNVCSEISKFGTSMEKYKADEDYKNMIIFSAKTEVAKEIQKLK